MSPLGPLDEQKSVRLRQRLWGAAVFIALLVIFVPLILDGSGSESQYRRVESLREEPPRVLNAEGVPEPVLPQPIKDNDPDALLQKNQKQPDEQVTITAEPKEVIVVRPEPEKKVAQLNADQLKAWVVQAGSFSEEANAMAVRDKLRRAGFPSFVTPSATATVFYRVQVGPMINLQQAEASRDKVMRLLEREAIVVSYP